MTIRESELRYLDEKKSRKEKEEENAKLINKIYKKVMSGQTVYQQAYIKVLLEHMGIQGKSYTSLAFKLGITTNTLYNWEKAHPEWKAAKDIALQGRVDVAESLLRDLADGKVKGNAAAAIFYSKNTAPDHFKDKREVEVTGGVTYMIDTGIPAKELPQQISNEIEAEFEVVEKEEEVEEDAINEEEEAMETEVSDEDLL